MLTEMVIEMVCLVVCFASVLPLSVGVLANDGTVAFVGFVGAFLGLGGFLVTGCVSNRRFKRVLRQIEQMSEVDAMEFIRRQF